MRGIRPGLHPLPPASSSSPLLPALLLPAGNTTSSRAHSATTTTITLTPNPTAAAVGGASTSAAAAKKLGGSRASSPGVKAAIATPLAIFALLVLVFAGYLVWRRRKRRSEGREEAESFDTPAEGVSGGGVVEEVVERGEAGGKEGDVQDEGAPKLPELEFEKKGGWKWEINGLQ